MLRKTLLLSASGLCLLVGGFLAGQASKQPALAALPATPAEGYSVHVTAPHVVDGHVMGPYHHYCKVIAPDPQMVCLIYESTESNAPLVQVEWMMAKKLTRPNVPLDAWNKNWHDHAIEIASGRVKVLDLPPEEAKKVADLASTTDGTIYHFFFETASPMLPNGKTTIAQAVGHKSMTKAEYSKY
jgi:hypothetical protein